MNFNLDAKRRLLQGGRFVKWNLMRLVFSCSWYKIWRSPDIVVIMEWNQKMSLFPTTLRRFSMQAVTNCPFQKMSPPYVTITGGTQTHSSVHDGISSLFPIFHGPRARLGDQFDRINGQHDDANASVNLFLSPNPPRSPWWVVYGCFGSISPLRATSHLVQFLFSIRFPFPKLHRSRKRPKP